jgi:hypothetical protein
MQLFLLLARRFAEFPECHQCIPIPSIGHYDSASNLSERALRPGGATFEGA